MLYKSFYQIRYYGFGDVSIVGATIDTLKVIAYKSNSENIEMIKECKKYIVNEMDWLSLGSLDYEYLGKTPRVRQNHSLMIIKVD